MQMIFVVSFYVRSSLTGTHGGGIGNGSDNSVTILLLITISLAKIYN